MVVSNKQSDLTPARRVAWRWALHQPDLDLDHEAKTDFMELNACYRLARPLILRLLRARILAYARSTLCPLSQCEPAAVRDFMQAVRSESE